MLLFVSMGTNSWISGAAVIVLTQIGAVLTGCGGNQGDPTPPSSGGSENVDHTGSTSGGGENVDTGSTSGGAGSGGSSSGASGGGGSGGSVQTDVGDLPHRELCIIEHGPCEDGVVHAVVGVSCTSITVTCEAGCSSTPTPVDVTLDGKAFLDDATVRQRITEALCAPVPDGVAGAPGNTNPEE